MTWKIVCIFIFRNSVNTLINNITLLQVLETSFLIESGRYVKTHLSGLLVYYADGDYMFRPLCWAIIRLQVPSTPYFACNNGNDASEVDSYSEICCLSLVFCICEFSFEVICGRCCDIKVGREADIIPYPTAFPYGKGMVLHFYRQQESSTTKTVHKVINKGLKAYV